MNDKQSSYWCKRCKSLIGDVFKEGGGVAGESIQQDMVCTECGRHWVALYEWVENISEDAV